MAAIKTAKKNSNFRKPYLSKYKNVKVSQIVITAPHTNGIFYERKANYLSNFILNSFSQSRSHTITYCECFALSIKAVYKECLIKGYIQRV